MMPFLASAGDSHHELSPYKPQSAATTAGAYGQLGGGLNVPHRDPVVARYTGEGAGQVLPHELTSYQTGELFHQAEVPVGSMWGTGGMHQYATAREGREYTRTAGGGHFAISAGGAGIATKTYAKTYSEAVVQKNVIASYATGATAVNIDITRGSAQYQTDVFADSAAGRR